MDLDKVGVGVASRVVVLSSTAVPDATILLGDVVLTNNRVRIIVSLLVLMQLASLLGGNPEVGGAREHVSSVHAATSSDHDIYRAFNAVLRAIAAQI